MPFLPHTKTIRFLLAVLPIVGFLSGCATGVRNNAKSFDTVIIDAGHGGHDSGARSRRGTLEKRVNLDVAKRLDTRLRVAGFDTVMTRRSDRFISLGKRTRISNRHKNAIFVSIHHNSAPNRRARGVETYYHHRYGKSIATKIQRNILRTASTTNRGVKRARFYVLRKNLNPAVLVECGFLTNSSEDRKIRTAAYREMMARQIADAIIKQRYGNRRPKKLSGPQYVRN